MSEEPVIIVGAGPAGVSAAAWLSRYDIPTAWFDATGIGGLLHRVNNPILDMPPTTFANGRELADALERFVDAEIPFAPATRQITEIRQTETGWRVSFPDETHRDATSVILATGTRYRRLGVSGEAEGLGSYVSQSATRDAERFSGRRVAVVGGGDAAFENACILADAGCDVVLLARSPSFAARKSFVDRVQSHPDITVAPIPSVVTSIRRQEDGCILHVETSDEQRQLDVAAVFVRIGVEPVLPPIEPAPQRKDGFVVVDRRQETSLSGLFAAGDVTDEALRSVVTASAAGARAARCCAEDLGLFQ